MREREKRERGSVSESDIDAMKYLVSVYICVTIGG